MRTDGVYCREYIGTGPVFPKAVPGTGAAFSGFTMSRFFVHLSFSTPTIGIQWICVIQKVWKRAFAKGGCSPLLFSMFFAAFINVAYTRFKADKDFMNAFVHLRK